MAGLGGGGLKTILGGTMSFMGSMQQADMIRSAGDNAYGVAVYNAQLEHNNLLRRLDLLGREIGRTGSTQRAIAGASGFSISSASTVNVMDETLRQFERQIIRERETSEERRQGLLYQGRIAQAEAEAQASAAEQAGFMNLFSSFGSLLG